MLQRLGRVRRDGGKAGGEVVVGDGSQRRGEGLVVEGQERGCARAGDGRGGLRGWGILSLRCCFGRFGASSVVGGRHCDGGWRESLAALGDLFTLFMRDAGRDA